MIHTIPADKLDIVLQEYFYSAWQKSSVMGFGILQDRPNATKEQVLANVLNSDDYAFSFNSENRVYADYVFGRMMKMGVTIKRQGEGAFAVCELETSDNPAKVDYQSWAVEFPNESAVMLEALKSVK